MVLVGGRMEGEAKYRPQERGKMLGGLREKTMSDGGVIPTMKQG